MPKNPVAMVFVELTFVLNALKYLITSSQFRRWMKVNPKKSI